MVVVAEVESVQPLAVVVDVVVVVVVVANPNCPLSIHDETDTIEKKAVLACDNEWWLRGGRRRVGSFALLPALLGRTRLRRRS